MIEQFTPKTTLDEKGFASESGWIDVATIDRDSREFTGCSHEFVSAGTGLAAGSYLDAPAGDCPAGKVWVRAMDNSGWEAIEDHRGTEVYDKATGNQLTITELGQLPEGVTPLAPPYPFSVWNEATQGWDKDSAAEQERILQQANALQFASLATANQQIAILTPAVEGDYAKPEHTQLLADWQRYRYELTQVPEQTGWPETPQWPTEPDKVI